MSEEKLIEEVAKQLASLDNLQWESLNEKTRTLFDGNTQSTYLWRANQIHELYKKYTWLKGDEKLPNYLFEIEEAVFKSTEGWKK